MIFYLRGKGTQSERSGIKVRREKGPVCYLIALPVRGQSPLRPQQHSVKLGNTCSAYFPGVLLSQVRYECHTHVNMNTVNLHRMAIYYGRGHVNIFKSQDHNPRTTTKCWKCFSLFWDKYFSGPQFARLLLLSFTVREGKNTSLSLIFLISNGQRDIVNYKFHHCDKW